MSIRTIDTHCRCVVLLTVATMLHLPGRPCAHMHQCQDRMPTLLPVLLRMQAQFGMCSSANPVVLLRLFPSLAPDTLLSPVLHLFPGAQH